jgi:metal-sulfur cluster biosynthetic enzyme
MINMSVSETAVYDRLKTVLDPELSIDLVSLGLIYNVSVSTLQTEFGERQHIHILMTLTTPGCPLAGVFDKLVKDSLFGLEGIEPDEDVTVELTFDPPWVQDMMSEEARAELGF